MWQSHFPAPVWKSAIADTVETKSMDYTAERLGISHQSVFTMRHKILMAMAEAPGFNDTVLGGVATAYLNRYNALFSSLFRNKGTLAARLEKALLSPMSGELWHSRER